jgi:hypothetical protein
MAHSVRLVVKEADGTTGVLVRKRRLRAKSLAMAKAEADSGVWSAPIPGNALEIVDAAGNVLASRPYLGRDVYVPWP